MSNTKKVPRKPKASNNARSLCELRARLKNAWTDGLSPGAAWHLLNEIRRASRPAATHAIPNGMFYRRPIRCVDYPGAPAP